MEQQWYTSPNPNETRFGYSRAVRRGPFIFVSGTTSIDLASNRGDSSVLHPTSAYHQTRTIFDEVIKVVERLGGKRSDIVRVRMFVASEEDVEDVGRAMKEVFGDIKPTATMVVGLKLVTPEMKVEIEADAVVLCVGPSGSPPFIVQTNGISVVSP